jgi:hypothetical protein
LARSTLSAGISKCTTLATMNSSLVKEMSEYQLYEPFSIRRQRVAS